MFGVTQEFVSMGMPADYVSVCVSGGLLLFVVFFADNILI